MNNSVPTNSPGSDSPTPKVTGFSPWQMLKTKRISYLALPLLIMATVTEFVILATGWKYQQVVCLPKGMGVTFFGIGPIGATILAVELLKLPLAIWTASRAGWQKAFMVCFGLPLICVLTFQLVKDMAVYEMGVAMTPASQMLEEATKEEVKISQLNGELAAIGGKKTDRDQKLAELAARKAKANADFEESLKRNQDSRTDAISLTDYQKKELSEVEARQATIINQFDADAAQLTKAIADLRTRREPEADLAGRWNAEEARIENAYKAKMSEYTNLKTAYDKDKAEYDHASFLKRQLLKEPVSPGVPPERESNRIIKPTLLAQLDEQIKAKEAELLTVNNKRRERVAQVDADARTLRGEFDQRSGTKREQSDRKREELLAAQAAMATQWVAEEKQINDEYASAANQTDAIRAQLDESAKKAEGFYEAREASIKNTQVHRIATTVEIVRGLFKGQRPVSIKATAKERGDLYTDQISMVRIYVYPVLAFIVAFLPTLMVELGFSTLFHPEKKRPAYRIGFLGRRLHWLYKRAGQQKIFRAERLAREAAVEISNRDKELVMARASAAKSLAEKADQMQAMHETGVAAATAHAEELKQKEEEWSAKLSEMNDALNQANVEKDVLRDFQHAEVERQVQMRQNTWSDRLSQARQELDVARAANEAERTAMAQEQQKKLLEVSEEWRNQVIQARRQLSDAELALEEKTAKLSVELKDAVKARDAASSQLQLQADSLSQKLTQAKEDASREIEKASRQEKGRLERQQMEFTKALRQSNEEFERQMKQRETELSQKYDARLAQELERTGQDVRGREEEFERQLEARVREVASEAKEETAREVEKALRQEKLRSERQQLEFVKTQRQSAEEYERLLKEHDQETALKYDARLAQELERMGQDVRGRDEEFERQLEVRTRVVEARAKEEIAREVEKATRQEKNRFERQQLESARALRQASEEFERQLKEREQELSLKNDARLAQELEKAEQVARGREEEIERLLEARTREVEARWKQELQEREEAVQGRLKQREQQCQAEAEVQLRDAQMQAEEQLHRRELEFERVLDGRSRDAETRLQDELQQKELAFHARLKQREQAMHARAAARETELQNQWMAELRTREEELGAQIDSRVRAAEVRLAQEAQQKEDALQHKLRQREQELQAQIDARQTDLQAELDQELRRHESLSAEAKQREQALLERLKLQAEAHQMAEKEWKMELEAAHRAIEPLKALLIRTEKEYDQELQSASEAIKHVHDLKKKLNAASSAMNNGKLGKSLIAGRE